MMTVEIENAAVEKKRSYIVRHWRGELSLAQSYWVNGVLVGLPFNFYFRIATVVFQADPIESPVVAFEWLLLPVLLMQPVVLWQCVGIWRSAGNSIREGRPGWAWVARLVVLASAIAAVYLAVIIAKVAWSMSLAYADQQTAAYSAAQTDGKVTFSGEITPESADRLEALLNKKGVDRLIIRESVGGYVLPALRLARVIRDRKLAVIIAGECSSMCTVLLAAGAERYTVPESTILLHAPSDVGAGGNVQDGDRESWEEMEAWYKRAGVREDLLAKIRAHHGPLDLYEPTMDELVKNGMVTYVFDERLSGYLPAPEWCQENPQPCARTGRQNLAAKRQAR
jgi:hypothetical protein